MPHKWQFNSISLPSFNPLPITEVFSELLEVRSSCDDRWQQVGQPALPSCTGPEPRPRLIPDSRLGAHLPQPRRSNKSAV